MRAAEGASVLIVGIPQAESVALAAALSGSGCRCVSVADGFEAVKIIATQPPDASGLLTMK